MPEKRILPEFQNFLISRKLVPGKNVPYYAHWASKFLVFSNKLDLSSLVAEFFHSLQSEKNIADWQIRQAEEEAVRFYLDNFKGDDVIKKAHGAVQQGKNISDLPRKGIKGIREGIRGRNKGKE